MWPEIPPVEPFESGIEELTGVRPYKGTLMYYRQLGVYDPYEAAEAPAPYPGVRAADVIYYLEQSHHKHQPARHTVQGQRVRANTTDTFRSQAPRTTRQQVKAPRESRELIGPPRPGRATELFQQGRARADNHVVDDSNVCPIFSRSKYKPGPRFTFTKSPWAAASESYIGDPREAFQESSSPPRERLCRQPPISKRQYKHPSEPQLGFSEMDYSHAPRRSGGGGISQMYHNQAQQEIRSSDTWKGGSGNRPGQSFKRFHAGVVPYETDFNRKASGWQSNYFHEDPTDAIFAQDDFDAPGSNRGGGGGQPQYGDYNARPKSWQGGQQQEPEEEPWVPLNQRRQTFEQEDQDQYYQQQHQQVQQHHQPQRHPQQAQQHRQPQRHPQQAQQHRQPQRRPVQQQHQPHHQGHQAPRPAPRPQGRGSAADYAGPQTWDANTYESDDL